jgi:hypothetical protein
MLAISKVLKIPHCCFVRVGPMNLEVKPQRDYIGKGRTARPCEISYPQQVRFCVRGSFNAINAKEDIEKIAAIALWAIPVKTQHSKIFSTSSVDADHYSLSTAC